MTTFQQTALGIIVTAAVIIMPVSCKKGPEKKTSTGAVVVHVAGKVLRARNETKTELKFRDLVQKGDQIITQKKSSVSLQIAEVGIVRLDADSKFTFESTDANEIEGVLEKGNIGAKFKKLKKNTIISLRTPTTVAAVRGTIFSLSIDKKGRSVVAVTEGKVAVKPADGGEEKIVEENKAAVVGKAGKIKVREIKKQEKQALAVLKDATVVPGVIDLSEEEAAKVFEDYEKREKKAGKKPGKKKVFKNIGEMKEEYQKLDEIKLFNGKTIQGKILNQNAQYLFVQVPGGMQKIAKKDVASRKVLK